MNYGYQTVRGFQKDILLIKLWYRHIVPSISIYIDIYATNKLLLKTTST
jgi:hypothetical protein